MLCLTILIRGNAMTTEDIIYRIGYIRNRANLSARALSLTIGKTESYINRLEQKGFEPSLSVLLEIITACGSSPEEFFYRDITRYARDKKTLDFLDSLPAQRQEAIIALLSDVKA